MIDVLTTKVVAWEREKGKEFTYDGVRLLSMLEDYMTFRQEKELDKKRQRDQKKIQDQLKAEQEALYGSKPSPSKPPSTKKRLRPPWMVRTEGYILVEPHCKPRKQT